MEAIEKLDLKTVENATMTLEALKNELELAYTLDKLEKIEKELEQSEEISKKLSLEFTGLKERILKHTEDQISHDEYVIKCQEKVDKLEKIYNLSGQSTKDYEEALQRSINAYKRNVQLSAQRNELQNHLKDVTSRFEENLKTQRDLLRTDNTLLKKKLTLVTLIALTYWTSASSSSTASTPSTTPLTSSTPATSSSTASSASSTSSSSSSIASTSSTASSTSSTSSTTSTLLSSSSSVWNLLRSSRSPVTIEKDIELQPIAQWNKKT